MILYIYILPLITISPKSLQIISGWIPSTAEVSAEHAEARSQEPTSISTTSTFTASPHRKKRGFPKTHVRNPICIHIYIYVQLLFTFCYIISQLEYHKTTTHLNNDINTYVYIIYVIWDGLDGQQTLRRESMLG